MSLRPLLVVALGGNAISPPTGDQSYAAERAAVADSARELADLARDHRLLVVHGNGPQVGRLLRADFAATDLDIHVAQTQGELGYLLATGLSEESGETAIAMVSRTEVDADDPAFAAPDKPIGPVLDAPPAGPAVRVDNTGGWRRVVASPSPLSVPELPVIGALLGRAHVMAGGGGGVPVDTRGRPCQAVVDKDRLAALLACALDARGLLFATDVEGAYRDFASAAPVLLTRLTAGEARRDLAAGSFAAGSMGPKVESAEAFVSRCGRTATIARLGALREALEGRAGTRIVPGE